MKNTEFKEFKPTSWAIDNRASIYVLVFIIAIFGIINYNTIPKEQFPEIVIPTIMVSTIYPGASPEDMQNLITRPIEKNIKSASGIKKISSDNIQDFSMIVVEFNTGIEQSDAKQRIKDAVDKSKSDLPNDLKTDPSVLEIDLSQIPIMSINISGDYNLDRLKKFGEVIQDKVEAMPEITRVDIVGALEREIQINVDMYKLHAASATLTDIERAIMSENMNISGGTIDMGGMSYSIRTNGEFKEVDKIGDIIFKSGSGAIVKLSDVAVIEDGFKKQESYSRFNGKNVVTLNVIKKSGKNLLDASEEINKVLAELKKDVFPKDVQVEITGNQARFTNSTLKDLNNTIIIGFILVVIVLMFFMGVTNAFFVALSVPLSMALAYIVMPNIGFTMNMLVMFAFIFALGIVVDDAIVVIENTHRIFKENKGRLDIKKSAKLAAGEVFVPILSGTLTTLAPFFPLAFWPGVVGKFMFFIPVTLIITLFASLIVAYIINPVFAVQFMKHDDEEQTVNRRKLWRNVIIIFTIGVLMWLISWRGFGNFLFVMDLLYITYTFWGHKMLSTFQYKTLPRIMNRYERLLAWAIRGRRPFQLFWGMIVLLFFTVVLIGVVKPKVIFFPDNEPNSVWVLMEMPIGTNVNTTDSITRVIEGKVNNVLGNNNPIVESIITNVAKGASDSPFDNTTVKSHKSKISINFVEFSNRNGASTGVYIEKIREALQDIKGVRISVEKNKMGPPTGKPVNIEITGEDLDKIIKVASEFQHQLEANKIPGLEEIRSDFNMGKPEIIVQVDREKANRQGITTAQVGSEIRTAILGKEVSKFRENEDQYPIQLRYQENIRENIDRLMDAKIVYRDMNSGLLRQIALSTVADKKYINNYGGIKRLNLKTVISISGNVKTGYTANEIVAKINTLIEKFPKTDGVEIITTGEQQDQKESMGFLMKAMLLAVLLIVFILIAQFNSFSRMAVIITEVVFSLIGVLLGFMIFNMSISIAMTGIGIVALAGIVVRNGILLVEFTDVLKAKGMPTRKAIIQAGKIRITPVLLTAATTILGLIPLALGISIDFVSLFTDFDPQFHMGGDNVMFFGPLAWAIVFGLTFATFLTLVMIPVMYYIAYVMKLKFKRKTRSHFVDKGRPELGHMPVIPKHS
ncbi:MAG: copper transporter [Bacteroidetes bacterium HGW-Bacteroidetes-21]|nr:MAG: copper transporter [Bacteroidetes bacterium HGW-Bacteroidetes-21]